MYVDIEHTGLRSDKKGVVLVATAQRTGAWP